MNSALPLVLVALLLGALVGLVLGRSRAPKSNPNTAGREADDRPGQVPEGVADLLHLASGPAILVGRHDEVVEATESAVTAGLVRGSRISPPPLLELIREARREGKRREVQLTLNRVAGGADSNWETRLAPFGDGMVIVLAEDRSEALRVDATRRDFVANVSHELKTPIGAISLLAEAVEQAAGEPEAVRKFAGRMRQESLRLTELVGQIIDLSRLQADDPLRSADRVRLDKVLAAAADRSRELAESRSVGLTVSAPGDLEVLGDADLLADAVSNLVHNAIVYSDEGARVAVAASRSSDDAELVEISVTDNGIGISEEDQKRIFERFYRVDYARSRGNGGTGLGLSIVSHIARSHGGRASVWSRPGEGSTFTITLPLAAPAANAAEARGAVA